MLLFDLYDPEEPGPVYVGVAAALRRALLKGAYHPGDRLPPPADIAKDFGVAIVSVRSAVALLEQEGLLRRHQGRGTYVHDDAVCGKSLVFDTGFKSLLRHLEGKSSIVLKSAKTAVTPLVDKELGILGEQYHFMQRIHLTDEIPYALINIHVRSDLYRQEQDRLDREMVIPILAGMPEIRGGRMQQQISFTTADGETAKHLQVPVNSAIGDVQRVITDPEGKIAYVGQTKYRGDFVNLKIDFDIPSEDI
ncbi:MAG: GntR family transcriptional regulator [Parvularcula sp.]|nr:GntR family transcriptional regulator [Parvularcula sp.]